MYLHFNMPMEDILGHTNGKCLCVHLDQVVDRCGNRHSPHNTIERPRAMILVTALEHQASKDDTYHEIVNL